MTSQVSCCVFDLETTNLSADFGVILCAVIKPAGKKCLILRADEINNKWHNNRSDDSKVLTAIIKELDQHDIWIAHNGAKFDVPFLRTRMLRHGMPPLVAKKLIDPVLLARNKLRMSYNSLEQIANHIGCNRKTEVAPEQWLRAALDGDVSAMDYIVKHCIQDVLTLEEIAKYLKVYSTTYNTYGSGF